jgi:hypothetical protein
VRSSHEDAAPTGKRGRQPDDSDAAIQACLTMLFGMALRQSEPVSATGSSPPANGFAESPARA